MKGLLLLSTISLMSFTYAHHNAWYNVNDYSYELIATSDISISHIYTYESCDLVKGESIYTNYMPISTSADSPAGPNKLWLHNAYLAGNCHHFIEYGIVHSKQLKVVTTVPSNPSYPHYPNNWVSYPTH